MDGSEDGRTVHRPQVAVDHASPVPLYHQISSALEAQVLSGDLPVRARIESEVELAARLGVSRPTARRALQELVDQGLLVRRRGVGTRVTSALVRRPVALTSLHDDLAAAGRTPRTELLEHTTRPADQPLADALGIEHGQEIVVVRRLRFADDEPLGLMTNYLRPELAPAAEELMRTGLYEALRNRGVTIRLAHQRIGARRATAAEARVLDERPGAALITMQRTAVADADTVVEYGDHVYRASRYSFETTLVSR